MKWQILVAMFIAIPVILLPVAVVWYLNSGRVSRFIKDVRERRAAADKEDAQTVAARVTGQGK